VRHFADDVQVVLLALRCDHGARDAVEVASRNPVFVEMTDRAAGPTSRTSSSTRGADFVLVYPGNP
jgi:hypothetical protein